MKYKVESAASESFHNQTEIEPEMDVNLDGLRYYFGL